MEPLVVLEYVARQTTSIADVWEEAIHEANLQSLVILYENLEALDEEFQSE